MQEILCEYQNLFGILLVILTIVSVVGIVWLTKKLVKMVDEARHSDNVSETVTRKIADGTYSVTMFLWDKLKLLVTSTFSVLPMIFIVAVVIEEAETWLEIWYSITAISTVIGFWWLLIVAETRKWESNIECKTDLDRTVRDFLASDKYEPIFGMIGFGPLMVTIVGGLCYFVWLGLKLLYDWYILQICGVMQ